MHAKRCLLICQFEFQIDQKKQFRFAQRSGIRQIFDSSLNCELGKCNQLFCNHRFPPAIFRTQVLFNISAMVWVFFCFAISRVIINKDLTILQSLLKNSSEASSLVFFQSFAGFIIFLCSSGKQT